LKILLIKVNCGPKINFMGRFFFILIVIQFLGGMSIFGQSKSRISPENYIQTYKETAIREMKRSGIPASITLAQGMLESDNGNSKLARVANNHFGIKCHDWKGKGFYQDDDKANECFRTYKNADESFTDHSNFLLTKQRYTFLFDLKTTDYKNWAKGLKKAGYATSPSYSEKLIQIIEAYNLQYFDSELMASMRPLSHSKNSRKIQESSDFTVKLPSHPVYTRNNVDFIIVKKNDTFNKLADELEMLNWELFKYNELTKDSVLKDGDILYLQPKRRKAAYGNDFHTVKEGETLYSVSQLYAIKLSRLAKLNLLKDTSTIKPGDVLNLRRKKK
jgi:LysM repeat protein